MAAPKDEVGVECIRTLVRNRCATSIRLLAARLWNSSLPGRDERESGLDIVGIDEEGNAIHVVIERKHAAYYRKTLKEGCIYILSNIGCILATHHRPVMRAERLRFNAATKVRHDVDFCGNIKRHHFEFQTYQVAATRLNKDIILTDLIGVITKIDDPSAGISKLGEGTRSKFYIQDLEGNEFPVNLWGDMSLKFQKLKLLDAKKTTIIIVCATSIKKFEGEIHASRMSPTKFYVNLEIPEVANYLARFEESKIIPEMLSKLSKRSYNVVSAEMIEQKSIADLLAGPSQLIKVGQKYNCTATVIGFEVDHGWFYTACTKCTRKVPPPETNMGCQVCNLSQLESMPWYRLGTMVEDTSGSTVFTVFGRVGEKLIGAPVCFLVNSPSMDPQCVHPLMDRVVGQSKIFQVTMKENSFGDRCIKFMVQNIFNVENDKPVSNVENLVVTTTVGSSVESSSSSNIPKRRLTSDLKQTVEGCIAPLPDKLETIESYAWNQSNQLPTSKCNDCVISEELPSAEKDAGKVGLDIPDCSSLGTTEERYFFRTL